MPDVVEGVKFLETTYKMFFNPTALGPLFQNEATSFWRSLKYFAVGFSVQASFYVLYFNKFGEDKLAPGLLGLAINLISCVVVLSLISGCSLLIILMFTLYWQGLLHLNTGIVMYLLSIKDIAFPDLLILAIIIKIIQAIVFINISRVVFQFATLTAIVIVLILEAAEAAPVLYSHNWI